MNTMQLSCFLTVAETLNFARAAQHLNVTQPAVTQQIHSLEEELNVKLFNRTTRTVSLTHAGLIFLNDAKNILDISERARKKLEDSFEDSRTIFIIGCHTHHEIYPFHPVLKEMKTRLPNICPVFRVIPFHHLYQNLEEEHIHVITAFQEQNIKKYGTYKELAKIPVTAVIPSDCHLAHKTTICLNDLKEEKLVVMEPRKYPDILGKIQYEAVKDRSALDLYFCDSVESSLTLARAGYGIAIVPDMFPLKDPALSYIPIADIPLMSYGVYYKKTTDLPALKTFISCARQFFMVCE